MIHEPVFPLALNGRVALARGGLRTPSLMRIRCAAVGLFIALASFAALADPIGVASADDAAKTTHTTDTAAINDGPYLTYDRNRLQAEWVCSGTVVRKSFAARRWPVTVPSTCGYPHAIQVRAPATIEPDASLSGIKRIVVLSDIHGQFDLAVRLLQANGIIDASMRWAYGDGHAVIVGDVFDRGPKVTETFWLLYLLQQQARDAGGDLHFLLGNHETMVLYDDLRYVNDKYLRSATALGTPYPALYGSASVIGNWMRTRPVILRINDLLFVHGGIEPNHFDLGLDREAVNQRYRASLGTAKATVKQDPLLAPLYDGKNSPIWYRGYFKEGELDQQAVDLIASRLGVNHIVVGHTSMEHIGSRFAGKVIAVDSSIKEGTSGELLFIENGRFERGAIDGTRMPLEPLP